MFLARFIKILALLLLVLSLASASPMQEGSGGKKQDQLGTSKQDVSMNKTAEKAKDTEIAESSVIISGNTSVLLDDQPSPLSQLMSKVKSMWSKTEPPDKYLWTCFSIRLRPLASQSPPGNGTDQNPIKVTISANGLGPTVLAYKDASGCASGSTAGDGPSQTCKVFAGTGGGWTKGFSCWQPVLELPIDQQEKIIGVRVPVGLVQQPGNAVEGKILIYEPKRKPVEIPLKIERSADPFNTGLEWFGGIALPALISFGLGYGASKLNTRLSSRTGQQQAFITYKDKHYDDVNGFFTGFYPSAYKTYQDDKTRAEELLKEMRKTRILRHVPLKERRKLEKALRSGRKDQIRKWLLELFGDWKQAIENPEQHQGTNGGSNDHG